MKLPHRRQVFHLAAGAAALPALSRIVGAPRITPPEIISKLNRKLNTEINAGLADPRMKARINDFGYTVLASSPADFGTFIAAYTEKWGKVIRAANIKLD